jgi:hypothetical protein
MKTMSATVAVLISVALAACGGPVATPESREFTDTDRAVILTKLNLSADAQGLVMNECGDLVTPQFLPAELGGAAGTAILFAIGGGPSIATCYGDGPDLHLFMREAAGWREIYAARGEILAILPSTTGGVRDLAGGGAGFSFPVFSWDGSRYAYAGRDISDAELSTMKVTYLPQ